MASERARLKRLKEMAEYGGMDVLYDYVMAMEREVEAYRRAAEKRRARSTPSPAGDGSR